MSKQSLRNIKIIGTAKYLPKKTVTDLEMDRILKTAPGWVAKKSGVLKRHFVEDENAPMMGAIVAKEALNDAGLTINDIDALICTSGTPAQPIPSNASLILSAMNIPDLGITSFDINSTCLSFIAGLDTISYAMQAGRYKRVLIISSEVTSVGLNFKEKESSALMGDGAVAIIVENNETSKSNILGARLETYQSGVAYAQIKGGGSSIHAIKGKNISEEDFFFNMNGHKIFRMASKTLTPFLDRFYHEIDLHMEDFNLIIPHQASAMSLRIIQKKIHAKTNQFYTFVEDHGNTVSASIPMGLHNAIKEKRIKRGDKVLLLGTGAGFTIGGLGLTY